VNFVLPSLPFLVEIRMTPLPPRAPKMAAEEASFRTSKDSMSFISRLPKKSLSTTIPSTTMSGDELLVIDPVPLTRMVGIRALLHLL
jgi:hypothetical protein